MPNETFLIDFSSKLMPVSYAISTRVLEKWARQNLSVVSQSTHECHFQFNFTGSTCNNGGTPFSAQMHVLVKRTPDAVKIESAWIDFSEDQYEPAQQQCLYQTAGETFWEFMKTPPDFCGSSIEAALDQMQDINPAGCFCTTSMRTHKWRNVLSTIHYVLSQSKI